MTVRGKDVMPLPPDVQDTVSKAARVFRGFRGFFVAVAVCACAGAELE